MDDILASANLGNGKSIHVATLLPIGRTSAKSAGCIGALRKGCYDGWRARVDDWPTGKRCQLPADVSGNICVKEIERLIRKLELDKEILADQDDEEENEVIK